MRSSIFAIATLYTLANCAARKPAEYSAALEWCRSGSRNCAEYVECRKRVSADFGREFSGHCDTDGGK